MGRLVITHSSYIDGLIPLLEKLSRIEGINTITPATIKRVKGHTEKLSLRISTKTNIGYKVLARKGKTVQEVFIVTKLDKDRLEKIVVDVINQVT